MWISFRRPRWSLPPTDWFLNRSPRPNFLQPLDSKSRETGFSEAGNQRKAHIPKTNLMTIYSKAGKQGGLRQFRLDLTGGVLPDPLRNSVDLA